MNGHTAATRKCVECGGSGKIRNLSGDWGKAPDREVTCWLCGGAGEVPRAEGSGA